MKFDFRSENLKRKFSSIIFACSLIVGCSKKNSLISYNSGFLEIGVLAN